MKMKTAWERGDKARLARAMGISPQSLSNILAGRACSPSRSVRFETESRALGYGISKILWAFPSERKGSPLFSK